MKWMGVNEIRESYLSFFESKGHLRHKSYPLVPVNDKSLLLINAGMAPLKKYFTGEEEPPRHRMTTCQKCIRTPDIDRVGLTARHGTFFEMLGNFSFGDYFKEEALPWAWEYITKVLEMPEDRLWATIYLDDDEAYDIWVNKIGLPAERVVRLGKEDNFWEHGSGPCGPCSEIHFDRGPEFGCGSPDCKPGCDCDRYMEFWNNVFTQFESDGAGTYTRLAKPNIDTGMGLERLACVMQGVDNLFEGDTVRKILDTVCAIAEKTYGADAKNDVSIRVVTDHIRSATFMISDGVIPSNEGRGYVLRRILRRAARHGKLLGINRRFLVELCDVVISQNETAYPELVEKQDYVKKVIAIEEERFDATIDAGLAILNTILEKAKADKASVISGEDVFKLYDTFGFPIDLTREIVEEQGFTVDEETFKALMTDQKNRARAARANISGWSNASKTLLADMEKTVFCGYETTVAEAKVAAILSDDMSLEEISEGDFSLILDTTPFYGEGGGQVGDTGTVTCEGAEIRITDTKKTDGVFIHMATVVSGTLKVGDTVTATVDGARRDAIRRNHSSVHMLQAALRTVLGTHVEQAGSYVDEKVGRFDFTHFSAMTSDEIRRVENLVNANILKGIAIDTVETDIETAKANGAMALFGEKYGKTVRMVKMGDYSCELCGGTHMDNTAKIGLFKITSESSVAAGVRRIEATTGLGVLDMIDSRDRLIAETAKELKCPNANDLSKRAVMVQDEIKALKREIDALNAKLASSKLDDLVKGAKDVKGVALITADLADTGVDSARNLCDTVKEKMPSAAIVLAIHTGEKLNFVAACGKDAVAKGAHAGNVLREISAIAGGKGGGRPDSAMSGGRDLNKIADALAAVETVLAGMIK